LLIRYYAQSTSLSHVQPMSHTIEWKGKINYQPKLLQIGRRITKSILIESKHFESTSKG
jgi:hypothetical protein